MKLKIPQYAKRSAKEALELRKKLPESRKFGLSEKKAKKLGIYSGVERAKQIIRNKYLDYPDVKSVVAFYHRFKNKRGYRAEGSIGLWGGRSFGREAIQHLKKVKGGAR